MSPPFRAAGETSAGPAMPLTSMLFQNDQKLAACLIHDNAHIKPGDQGGHVAKIQAAVCRLDGYAIIFDDVKNRHYGRSTAAAIHAFKKKRKIINHSYQAQADDIVGKLTIAALDREIAVLERLPRHNNSGLWEAN